MRDAFLLLLLLIAVALVAEAGDAILGKPGATIGLAGIVGAIALYWSRSRPTASTPGSRDP